MRLFVALELPASVRPQLAQLQFPARLIRWTPPDQFHLTLAFLGEQPEHQLHAICNSLQQVQFKPFELCCDGAGFFPHGALWLSVMHSTELMQLQQRIARTLEHRAIRFEHRRFHPHITLGRCRSQPALAAAALQHRVQPIQFEIDRFVLKSSVLRQDGAVHQEEAEFLAD